MTRRSWLRTARPGVRRALLVGGPCLRIVGLARCLVHRVFEPQEHGLLNGGTLRIITGGSFRLRSYQRKGNSQCPRQPFVIRAAGARQASSVGPPELRRRRLANPSVFLFVILTAQLMVILDSTIVNVALPHIQESLGFSTSSLSWVLNAYILTFGGLLLLGARAGDLFGRRRTFLVGIAIFTLGSLMGGLAPTGWVLLAARAAQGVGAALAAPSALSLLTAVFAEGPERVRAIGLYTTVSAAGGATGLVAGGVLTQLASWRWVMSVNVPIRRRPSRSRTGRHRRDRAAPRAIRPGRSDHLDPRGHWDRVRPGGGRDIRMGEPSDGLGVSCRAGPRRCLCRPRGTSGRAHIAAAAPHLPTSGCGQCQPGSGLCRLLRPLLFMGQFLQDLEGYSPLVTGLAFLPMPASVFVSSQFASRFLLYRLSQKAVMAAVRGCEPRSVACHTDRRACRLPADRRVDDPHRGRSGTAFVALTSASLAEVAKNDAGAASGLVNVSQQIGAALGLAVLVTVFEALTGHVQLRTGMGTSTAAVTVVHALDAVFGIGALFAVAGLVTVLVGCGRRGPVLWSRDHPWTRATRSSSHLSSRTTHEGFATESLPPLARTPRSGRCHFDLLEEPCPWGVAHGTASSGPHRPRDGRRLTDEVVECHHLGAPRVGSDTDSARC